MFEFLVGKEFLTFAALAGVLIYASVCDVRTRTVSDSVSLLIIFLTIGGMNNGNLGNMLLGALLAAGPLFLASLINRANGFGGADIKLAFAIGFMLGAPNGFLAVLIGLACAVLTTGALCFFRKKPISESFPLIPYLSAGMIVMYLAA